jgi:hypothetical protein
MQITKRHVAVFPQAMSFIEGYELASGSRIRSCDVRFEKKLNRLQCLVLLVGSMCDSQNVYCDVILGFPIAAVRHYDHLTDNGFNFDRLTKNYFNVAYGYCERDDGQRSMNRRPKLFRRVSRGKYALTRLGQLAYESIVALRDETHR